MNRLSNYFKCQKLVRAWLVSAESAIANDKPEAAFTYVMNAQRDMLTAMNNVASIAFHQKPKGKGKIK